MKVEKTCRDCGTNTFCNAIKIDGKVVASWYSGAAVPSGAELFWADKSFGYSQEECRRYSADEIQALLEIGLWLYILLIEFEKAFLWCPHVGRHFGAKVRTSKVKQDWQSNSLESRKESFVIGLFVFHHAIHYPLHPLHFSCSLIYFQWTFLSKINEKQPPNDRTTNSGQFVDLGKLLNFGVKN
jgi:hypothetical protein